MSKAVIAVLTAAVEQAEAVLDLYKNFSDSMPLTYPYAVPPGAVPPPRLDLGLLRALTAAARASLPAPD